MEVIVELVNRAHKVIERHRYQGEKCRIGRAFDNDIILSEAHVSPHHAVLSEDPQGNWWLEDLDSLNGLLGRHHRPLTSPVQIKSGDELIIGKAHLKFYSSEHPVDEAVGMGGGENLIYALSQPMHFFFFAFSAVIFFATTEYLRDFNKFEFKTFLPVALGTPAVALVWASLWALAGRILRHEPRFVSQCIVAFVYLIIVQCVEMIFSVLSYNTSDFAVASSLVYIVHGVLAAWMLSYNLRLATHQSKFNRNLTANAVVWGMVGLVWLESVYSRPSFQQQPEYSNILLPPTVRWSSPVTIEQFEKDYDFIFTLPETAEDR